MTGSASVTTGRMRSAGRPGTQPATGSQRSQIPKTSMSSGAMTNTGTEMPATASVMTSRSASPATIECGQDSRRNADGEREQQRGESDRQADRQPVCNQLADGEIAELVRRPEIAVQEALHIAAELHVHRLVEPISRLQVGADLGRQGLLLVERPAGREAGQQKRQRHDERERRYCAEEAPHDESDGGHPAAFVAHGAPARQRIAHADRSARSAVSGAPFCNTLITIRKLID